MTTSTAIQPKEQKLLQIVESLEQATDPPQHPDHDRLHALIDAYTRSAEGTLLLHAYAGRLDQAGVFKGTVWADPTKLVPALVRGTLKADYHTVNLELLSELRMLRYATGQAEQPDSEVISREDALAFLQEVLVANLDLAFPEGSEELRVQFSETELKKIGNLFALLMEHIPLEHVKSKLAEEVEQTVAQKPILTGRLQSILRLAGSSIQLSDEYSEDRKLLYYVRAYEQPTSQSAKHDSAEAYAEALPALGHHTLKQECLEAGQSLRQTGLVSAYTEGLFQHVAARDFDLLPILLHLDAHGQAEFERHPKLIGKLVEAGITPHFRQSIFGLACLLERGLLSRPAVESALKNFLQLEVHPESAAWLSHHHADAAHHQALLTGGLFCILGQPLGIGQGMNPTCQSARGLSMWSQHAPAKLINMVINAVSYHNLEMRYGDDHIRSRDFLNPDTKQFDFNLDPIQVVMVHHLDAIYQEMMRRAPFKHPVQEPHASVNPAFYGHWIPTGFASPYKPMLNAIQGYDDFVRRFYAGFHPDYNGGSWMVYPNPVGIIITSANAEMLGFHAVSMLRVGKDKQGQWRIYFLNPNNEGRQNWGQEIKPTVSGHGEKAGESSLPFHEFLSRLYAFHYNTVAVEEHMENVPAEEIARVRKLAQASWGKSYLWMD